MCHCCTIGLVAFDAFQVGQNSFWILNDSSVKTGNIFLFSLGHCGIFSIETVFETLKLSCLQLS